MFDDPEMAAIFSDERFVQHMLEVEAALSRAQAKLGVIPAGAGDKITEGVAQVRVDTRLLRASTEKAGIPVIELVRQLREQVGEETASYVHWGATSQDIMDTALVLQIRSALGALEETLQRLTANLAELSDRHRNSLMAGRTHSQQALPIPFGLKVAGWLAPLLRHRQRLSELKARVLAVQLGGAAGTLAPFGALGVGVQEELASELALGVLVMPWHTQRDNLAELAGWLSMVSGSLAKMAQDVILLAQSEVAEARESSDSSRGGSSTMPQKNNPVVSEHIIAAARTNASLLAAMHQALVQEHERGTHGWQVEWLTLPQMFFLTAAASKEALLLSAHLTIDEERMRQNVAASNGLMLAEAVSFALADTMSRSDAQSLVKEACQLAVAEDRHLIDVVKERTDAPIDWQALKDETAYFGSSQKFIDRVLEEVERVSQEHNG